MSGDEENQTTNNDDPKASQTEQQREQARRDKERELFKRLSRVKTYPVVLEPDVSETKTPNK